MKITRSAGALAFALAASPSLALAQQNIPAANGTGGQIFQGVPAVPCYAPSGGGNGICTPVASDHPLPSQMVYGASGVTPITPALTSTTCTSAFTPIAGRGFNVSAWGTFVAGFQLVRSFDGGTTKLPITAAGTQLYVWTAPESEQAEETEFGVSYYVCVTSYTSGTLNLRLSQ